MRLAIGPLATIARGHDEKPVRDADAEIEILLDEQDAEFAFAFEGEERIANLIDDVGLDTLGGFIEQ